MPDSQWRARERREMFFRHMPTRDAKPATTRRLSINSTLWLLAIVLGAATIHAGASTIHDTSRLREGARIVAHAMAQQVVLRAKLRYETAAWRNTEGRPVRVLDLVAARPLLIDSLFIGDPDDGSPMSLDSIPAVARLEPRSIEVRSADGRMLYGRLDQARPFRATVAPTGALEGLVVTVGLAPSQIAGPLIAPIATGQLWHLGALLLATIVMLAVAMLASRREAVLARARADFVAGVSHELRMPLAQILLASETLVMQRERHDSERLTLASSILREARRLIALVENVLLFSRTGATGLRPRLEAVAIDALLTDVVESVQLAADDIGQTIELAPAPGLGVVGDRSLLRQALVNLVDNAMKYGAEGQHIRLLVDQPGDGRIRLIIEDEGRGVPHAERARVFEPYERLARDRSSERTGTGLGLAVVRQIVAACNGRVWLEETSSGGTRAIVELAAAQPMREATAPSGVG